MTKRRERLPVLLFVLALSAGLATAVPDAARAQGMDGEDARWMVRSHVSGVLIDGTSPTLGLDVGDALSVGVDATYFASPRIGVNLLAAFISPEVESDALGASLGSVDALPPALTVQYHFADRGAVRPYLGAGGSLVAFYGYSGALEEENVDIEAGFGPVAQGGVNLFASDRFLVMADVRWVWLLNDPEVTSDIGGDELDFSHGVFSIGVGYTP